MTHGDQVSHNFCVVAQVEQLTVRQRWRHLNEELLLLQRDQNQWNGKTTHLLVTCRSAASRERPWRRATHVRRSSFRVGSGELWDCKDFGKDLDGPHQVQRSCRRNLQRPKTFNLDSHIRYIYIYWNYTQRVAPGFFYYKPAGLRNPFTKWTGFSKAVALLNG